MHVMGGSDAEWIQDAQGCDLLCSLSGLAKTIWVDFWRVGMAKAQPPIVRNDSAW
jgi:hypothetical protein